MALRIQLERQSAGLFPSLREYHTLYGIRPEHLEQNPDLWVMHPGPVNRGVELAGEVVDSDRAVILNQVTNGVAVRMGGPVPPSPARATRPTPRPSPEPPARHCVLASSQTASSSWRGRESRESGGTPISDSSPTASPLLIQERDRERSAAHHRLADAPPSVALLSEEGERLADPQRRWRGGTARLPD